MLDEKGNSLYSLTIVKLKKQILRPNRNPHNLRWPPSYVSRGLAFTLALNSLVLPIRMVDVWFAPLRGLCPNGEFSNYPGSSCQCAILVTLQIFRFKQLAVLSFSYPLAVFLLHSKYPSLVLRRLPESVYSIAVSAIASSLVGYLDGLYNMHVWF